jgi:hypothetical protein
VKWLAFERHKPFVSFRNPIWMSDEYPRSIEPVIPTVLG